MDPTQLIDDVTKLLMPLSPKSGRATENLAAIRDKMADKLGNQRSDGDLLLAAISQARADINANQTTMGWLIAYGCEFTPGGSYSQTTLASVAGMSVSDMCKGKAYNTTDVNKVAKQLKRGPNRDAAIAARKQDLNYLELLIDRIGKRGVDQLNLADLQTDLINGADAVKRLRDNPA